MLVLFYESDYAQHPEVDCGSTVGPLYPRFLPLCINQLWTKNIFKKFQKVSESKLNFSYAESCLHSIYIVFTTVYMAFTLYWYYKYSRDYLQFVGGCA